MSPEQRSQRKKTNHQHLLWRRKPTGCVGRRVGEHPSLRASTRLRPNPHASAQGCDAVRFYVRVHGSGRGVRRQGGQPAAGTLVCSADWCSSCQGCVVWQPWSFVRIFVNTLSPWFAEEGGSQAPAIVCTGA